MADIGHTRSLHVVRDRDHRSLVQRFDKGTIGAGEETRVLALAGHRPHTRTTASS